MVLMLIESYACAVHTKLWNIMDIDVILADQSNKKSLIKKTIPLSKWIILRGLKLTTF